MEWNLQIMLFVSTIGLVVVANFPGSFLWGMNPAWQDNIYHGRRLQQSAFARYSSRFRSFLRNAWNCGGPNVDSMFTIALDLQGVDDESVFREAATKWSQVIVGDVPDYSGSLGGESTCGPWPSQIDDVYVCGKFKSIDGEGGVLGSASPRHYRPTEGIPLTGEMSFDAADVGRLNNLFGVIVSMLNAPERSSESLNL